jgi:hypothetical protein
MNHKLDDWLNGFTALYMKQGKSNFKAEIAKLFKFDEKTVVVGARINEWCQTIDEVNDLLLSQLSDYQYEFNFDQADIYETSGQAFISSIGRVSKKVLSSIVLDDTIAKSLDVLSTEVSDQSKAFKASRTIAEALIDLELGENYCFPLRFSVFLVEEDDYFKASHMQFSFDAEFLWQHRYLKMDDLKESHKLPHRADSEEIRSLLSKLQQGYTNRDQGVIDDYMTLFSGDDHMMAIGTDFGEYLKGHEAVKEMIVSDWEYWGDFRLDIDGAVITEFEEAAFFTTKASIHQTHDESVMEDSAVKLMTYKLEDETMPKKMRLLEALKATLALHYEKSLGKDYYAPMRFSGYLIKCNNQWKVQYLQFSDHIISPEKRQSVCS